MIYIELFYRLVLTYLKGNPWPGRLSSGDGRYTWAEVPHMDAGRNRIIPRPFRPTEKRPQLSETTSK